MKLARGCLVVSRLRGVPVRVHWSFPIGAIVAAGASANPLAWLGFLALIVVHEMGHVALMRYYGLRPTAIVIHALGGECHGAGYSSELAESVIAWGGVAAQALLLAAALVLAPIAPLPWLEPLWSVLVTSNLAMMALNLLPIAPLDGALAWRLPWRLWSARHHLAARASQRRARARAETQRLEREVARLERRKRASP